MDAVSAFGSLYVPLFLVFACVFYFLRWWQQRKRNQKRRGFCPSYSSLGNALQQLQTIAEPPAEHVVLEKLKEPADQDDEGDDPTKHLRRQLERLRRGEKLDKLTTIVRPNK
jgi:hypothetical protein